MKRFLTVLAVLVVFGVLGAAAFFFLPHGLEEVQASADLPKEIGRAHV